VLFLDVLRHAMRPANRRFVLNLLIAFLPAAAIGFLARDFIKERLFSTGVVALALIVGGVAILLIERWQPVTRHEAVDGLPLRTALGVGLAQVLALVPGVSRSGATILGGYALGMSRRAAAEFSFFLAMPTMTAAFAHDLIGMRHALSPALGLEITVGLVMAFVSSLLVIRPFLFFVRRSGFAPFAWYRIAVGGAILAAVAAGWMQA